MDSTPLENVKSAIGLDRLTQLNDKVVGAGKHVGNLYLDGYINTVESITTAQQKLVEKAPNERLKKTLTTQIDLSRQMATTFTSAAREILA